MVSKLMLAGMSLAVCGAAGALPIVSSAEADSASCEPVVFRVYFEPNSDQIGPEAQELIQVAMDDARPCGQVDVAFAADPRKIDDDGDRRLTSERSVSVLSALRERGFDGGVSVTTVNRMAIAAELNVGPEFVEVTLEPRVPDRSLLASAG